MGAHAYAWKPRLGPDKACSAFFFVLSFLPVSTFAFSTLGTQPPGSIMPGRSNGLWNRMRSKDDRSKSPAFPRDLFMKERDQGVYHERQLNRQKSKTPYSEILKKKLSFEVPRSSRVDFVNSAKQNIVDLYYLGFAQAFFFFLFRFV
jgi:hypothetical protein